MLKGDERLKQKSEDDLPSHFLMMFGANSDFQPSMKL